MEDPGSMPSKAPVLVHENTEAADKTIQETVVQALKEGDNSVLTSSHALADKSKAHDDIQDMPDVDHDNHEVLDLGWNKDDDEDESRPLVQGLRNEELWILIRRFNKQTFEVRSIEDRPLANLDMNIAEQDEFSPDKLRAHLERAYVSVVIKLLSVWNHVARLQSWRESSRTSIFLAVYSVAWFCDALIPAMMLFLIALMLSPDVRDAAFPPAPIALIDSKTGGKQTPPAGVLATEDTATGAPEAVQGEGAEQEAHSFVNSIGLLAFSTATGDPAQDEDIENAEESGAGQLAQDVAKAESNASKGNAGIRHGKTKAPVSRAVWSKTRPVMHGLADFVDTWERFGNIVSPTPPFPTRSPRIELTAILLSIALASYYTTAYMFVKGLGLLFGLLFFGQPILNRARAWLDKRYPAWQRLLELRNSILKGVPTNAQLAITLLRIGEKNRAPLPPPPSSDLLTVKRNPAAIDDPNDKAASGNKMATDTENSKPGKPSGKGRGVLDFLKSTVKGGVKTALAADRAKAAAGAHHAKERRGVVKYDADRPKNGPVRFEARYKGQKGYAYLTETSTTPALSWSLKADDVHPAWSIFVSDIEELKKVGGLAWPSKVVVGWSLQKRVVDGLVIKTKNGNEYHLTAVLVRDEIFNRLIAMGDQMWELW